MEDLSSIRILDKYFMEKKDQGYNFDEEEFLVATFVIIAVLSYAVTNIMM